MPRAFRRVHAATAAGTVLLSALLVAAAFPPLGWWPLVFVAFGPVLAVTGSRSPLQAFVLGWSCWAVAHAVGTAWLVPVLGRMQGRGVVASTALFCGYAAWEGIPVGFGGLAVRQALLRLRPPGRGALFLLSAVGAAGVWASLEGMFPRILPWSLGNALVPAAELRQAADLCGGTGLTFLIVLVNTLLVGAVLGQAVGPGQRLAAVAGVSLVLTCAWAYGAARLRTHGRESRATAPATYVRVALVQAALEPRLSDNEADDWRFWTAYATLTRSRTSPAADLIVWPETVLRSYLRYDIVQHARLRELVR